MITALRQKVTVRRGGWISLRFKALKAGERAEVIVLVEPEDAAHTPASAGSMTAHELLSSGLVGMWSKKNIGDSLKFAHTLRSISEKRGEYK